MSEINTISLREIGERTPSSCIALKVTGNLPAPAGGIFAGSFHIRLHTALSRFVTRELKSRPKARKGGGKPGAWYRARPAFAG